MRLDIFLKAILQPSQKCMGLMLNYWVKLKILKIEISKNILIEI